MINFASLFNQFRMNNNSIGDLIDSPGVTLDRLLDQESFTNQFKSGNSKVQQFMKYDKFETLVKYVTEVGPAQDRKRSYKFPLSSCELLSSDSSTTLDFFFGQNPIIVREEIPNDPQVKKQKENAQASSQQKEEKQETTAGQQKKAPQQSQKKQSDEVHLEGESNTSSQQIQEQDKAEHDEKSVEATPKTKIVQKQVEPLRFQLFSYFKGEVNYTLAGYVSKIFSSFFVKKPVAVSKFLLDPERFKLVLNHIESRSVGQLILKMLSHESTQLLQERKYAFEQLLQKVSKTDQVYIISNLATAICEIIQKVALSVKNNNQSSIQLSKIYFNPAIITQIISNVMSDEENVSVYNAPVLQTYLLNVPLLIPEKSQISEDLKSLLQTFVKKTLQKIKVRRQERSTLGFGRMKIIQIISFVLKQNILNARELVASEAEFFSILFNLCSNYQYNNVLHNEVVKITDIALNQPQNSLYLQSLLKDDIFLKFLINEAEEDQKILAGSGSQKARKGYIGHIVYLCRKIKELSTKNTTLAKFIERKQFDKIYQTLVEKQLHEYNKNLAGFAMKRSNKHPILFGKQQILQEHLKFLAASPPPVFQVEAQHVNIQHPDLIQAEKVQMQAEAKEIIEQQTKQEEKAHHSIQQEQHYNPRFFQNHMNYNIDELMDQL